jgi:hypothetical protein
LEREIELVCVDEKERPSGQHKDQVNVLDDPSYWNDASKNSSKVIEPEKTLAETGVTH